VLMEFLPMDQNSTLPFCLFDSDNLLRSYHWIGCHHLTKVEFVRRSNGLGIRSSAGDVFGAVAGGLYWPSGILWGSDQFTTTFWNLLRKLDSNGSRCTEKIGLHFGRKSTYGILHLPAGSTCATDLQSRQMDAR